MGTNRGFMDTSWTQIRNYKETEWIKRLRTAFPHVLNIKWEKHIICKLLV